MTTKEIGRACNSGEMDPLLFLACLFFIGSLYFGIFIVLYCLSPFRRRKHRSEKAVATNAIKIQNIGSSEKKDSLTVCWSEEPAADSSTAKPRRRPCP